MRFDFPCSSSSSQNEAWTHRLADSELLLAIPGCIQGKLPRVQVHKGAQGAVLGNELDDAGLCLAEGSCPPILVTVCCLQRAAMIDIGMLPSRVSMDGRHKTAANLWGLQGHSQMQSGFAGPQLAERLQMLC